MFQAADRLSSSSPEDIDQLTSMLSKFSITEKVRSGADKLPASDQPFPFLRLPAEIRNHIYRECLLVEGIINPYPLYYQDQRIVPGGQVRPSVALLRVSKQVECEAQAILYGENTYHLNLEASFTERDRFRPIIRPLWKRFMVPGFDYRIGHVIISFDFRDLDQICLGSLYSSRVWAELLSRPGTAGNHSVATRSENAHTHRSSLLNQIWLWKINVLTFLVMSKQPIKRLTLDFSNCYCPGGCCRPAGRVLDTLKSTSHVRRAFRRAYLERLHGTKPIITGLLFKPEKDHCLEAGFDPALIA
ncbi:MAG: hypothetical protein Q9182_001366 [Xanthomendoza sp. 2 TL-2023]